MDEMLFTPVALLDLLSQVDELKQYELGLSETPDGLIQLQIGESVYELEDDSATDIPVDSNVIDKVESINDAAYNELVDRPDLTVSDDGDAEPIESGIIKELAKTLLVGGLVRLASKSLKN